MTTNFTYSTELQVNGPWLIPRSALEELDQVLDRGWESWNELKVARLAEEVAAWESEMRANGHVPTDAELQRARERVGSYHTRDQRTVRVMFKDGKSLRTDTLGDALAALSASNEKVVGFHVSMIVAGHEAEVSAGGRSYQRNSVNIRVTPETAVLARDVFGSLRQWVKRHEPAMWQRLWDKVGWIHWYAWFLVLLVMLSAVPTTEANTRRAAVAQADSLVSSGISPEEVPKAIELLLRIETRLVEGQAASQVPRSVLLVFWAGLLIGVVLSIRPKVVIGIGAGEDSVKRWARWMHVVGFTIPGIVFGSFVLPYVVDAVNRLFTN